MLTRSYRGLTFDAKALNDEARSIDVIASTPTEDSYEEVVEQSWRLDRYKKNPVVLYEHGHASGAFGGDSDDKFPIGRAENVRVEAGALRATLVIAPASVSDRAERVWQALKGGFLRAVSVGFRPHNAHVETRNGRDVYVLSDNELYEISVVAIPANPDAVAEQRAKSLRELKQPAADSAASVPNKEPANMAFVELLAKRFGCEASEAAIAAYLDHKDGEVSLLKSRSALAVVALSALGLADGASEGDVTKSIVALVAKASKTDELEPKLVELNAQLSERASADAEREVDWLVKRGKGYGFDVNEKSKRALLAYRKSDPKGFAEDYAPALEGLKNFDDAKLFQDVAAQGADAVAPPPSESVVTLSADDEIEQRVDALIRKAAAEGKPITRAKALNLVVRDDA